MASIPDVDEVSSMLKRSFREIQTVTEALHKLNDFLEATDAESVEKLLSQLAETSLEQTEEKDCLVMFSEIVQERRVVNFLSRAVQGIPNRVSEIGYREEEGTSEGGVVEGTNPGPFYTFVNEYFDSSNNNVFALLTEGSPTGSTLSIPGSGRRGGLFKGNRNFDRPYWIEVSGLYKIWKMLENGHQLHRIVQDKVHARLCIEKIDRVRRHSVNRNRYMFAFDDGTFHCKFQSVIEQALCDHNKFSELHNIGESECLSTVESWELFCRVAFRDEPGRLCPVELQQLSKEIVKMCKGFPLPIVGIAGLLSNTEKQESEWQRVRNSFKVEVKTSLPLPRTWDFVDSFGGLPGHLAECFLYFGVFPRDSVIPNEKLFKLWITEGFVQETIGKTLEEVAEEYLNELIRRNLVRSFQGLNRLERFCKLYDPSIFYFIRVDKQGSLWYKKNHVNIFPGKMKGVYRRSIWNDVDPKAFDSILHSLFVFSYVGDINFLFNLIKKCWNLTVLDFEYQPIKELPEELEKLVRLKYLSLKNTKLRKLPKSVDKLVNLQTLDVRNTLLEELPVEINMLNKLRHLLASVCDDGIREDPSRGVRLRKGIGRLHNLHTLMTVEVQDNNISLVKEIAMLKQLRTLGVSGLSAKTVKALCACIGKLVLLKSLTLQAKNGEEVLNLGSVSSELPLLQRLVLKGQFHSLPNWIFRLQNLSVLCLSLAQLTEEQLMLLSHLPNLVTLWLCRAYKGQRLYFKQGSFKKLKLLVLREFHGLIKYVIEDGALPCLEELRIGSSPFLDEVPSGIQCLKNLKILISYDMPNEFVLRMQPNGGSDYWKVKHIPSVFFLCRVQGRKYKLFELGEPELVDHLLGLATNAYHITEPQDEHEFTFFEEDNRDVNPTALQRRTQPWSFTSSLFTDDVEM